MTCGVFEKKQRQKHIKNNQLYRWREYNDSKIHNRFVSSVFDILKLKSQTIPELAYELTVTEYDIISAIGDLESMNKVSLMSWKPFYRPDGCVAFIAVCGCIDKPCN